MSVYNSQQNKVHVLNCVANSISEKQAEQSRTDKPIEIEAETHEHVELRKIR